MKKVITIILCNCLLFSTFFSHIGYMKAKTLGELKRELQNLESTLNKNQNETQMTQEQINQTSQNIQVIKTEIEQANKDIQNLIAEINKMNEEIKKKDQEIKSLINFVQVANGESAYMEYIFGAKNFTDLIYRVAISEQMVNYNEKLINEYNEMINKNNKKQEDLKAKQATLGQKQVELEQQMAKLGEKMESLQEGKLDINEQIKAQKEAINALKGCRDSEDASSCAARLAANSSGGFVGSNGFIRPITAGYVSSNYGWRYHPTQSQWRLHTGIDVSASGNAVPIYPGANGRVAAITKRSSCGGNTIYIHHTIGGKKYTSVYMHLRSIMVSIGQNVTVNTQIATMGGNPSIEYWDKCSTGQHLHYTLATGFYFIDYSTYSSFEAHTFDPRKIIKFPAVGGYFSGR